jgi:hypothetical protein
MSGELQAQHVPGATLYAVLVDANGGVWNGAAFDATPTSGEWASYDIAMAEQGGIGYYAGDLPGVSAGRYGYRVHKQIAEAPAVTDPVIWTGELDTNATPASAPEVWAGLTAAAANRIADHVLRRTQANAKASADGDAIADGASLYGIGQQHRRADTTTNPGFLTVFNPDGSELEQIPLASTAAADDVTGVG